MAEHHTITDPAKLHEAKQIAGASPADAGKVITPSSSIAGQGELRKLTLSELSPQGGTAWTGWGKWADAVYTSGSPMAPAAVRTQLTNDGQGARTNTSHLPSGGAEYWDSTGNRFVIDSAGDAYMVSVSVTAATETPDSFFVIELDAGGTEGVVASDVRSFYKGTGTAHNFTFTWPLLGTSSVSSGGATVYITPSTADQTFWNIECHVVKTHSAG